MYDIACIVDKGATHHGDDDRGMISHTMIHNGNYVSCEEHFLAIICDGVSGEDYGGYAAEIVTNYFAKADVESISSENIMEYLSEANVLVKYEQMVHSEKRKMATTIAGVLINSRCAMAFNVGDSRVYEICNEKVKMLSMDHSLAEDMMRKGVIPEAGMEHILTQYIGGAITPNIVDFTGKENENGEYLICSDGISDVLSYADIREIFGMKLSAEETGKMFIKKAYELESDDNYSVIVIREKM